MRFTNFVLINQRPRVTSIPNTSPKSDVRTKYPVCIPVNHNAKKNVLSFVICKPNIHSLISYLKLNIFVITTFIIFLIYIKQKLKIFIVRSKFKALESIHVAFNVVPYVHVLVVSKFGREEVSSIEAFFLPF